MKLFMISTVDTPDLDSNHQEYASRPQAPKKSQEIDDYLPSSGNSSASKGLTKQQAKAFSDKWTKVHLIPVDIVLAQLGVSKLSEFDGTLADAEKQMDTYLRISSEVDKGR